MKIVFDNREKRPVCTCNVCGRTDKWSNRWQTLGFGVGVGYRGEDRTFFTCSKECRKKDEEEKLCVKYMKKLHEEWWAANGEYVDDFEKECKDIISKQYEKELNSK